MMLPGLIVSLLLGGSLAWLAARWHASLPRWLSLITLGIHFACVSAIWIQLWHAGGAGEASPWLMEFDRLWIPEFGVHFHLGLDGLSLLLIALSDFLGMMAVLASWQEIQTRTGFYHFNLLAILAALIGVFLALDLFLFYVFWEVMLVPLYFLDRHLGARTAVVCCDEVFHLHASQRIVDAAGHHRTLLRAWPG